ncbi:MAG TPA: EAL domain-containing protein [Candidatus Dormibacteraeota bacterium]|nr:EAL domain-containing protein [Candidatus Dormibacteraeota bacterium]
MTQPRRREAQPLRPLRVRLPEDRLARVRVVFLAFSEVSALLLLLYVSLLGRGLVPSLVAGTALAALAGKWAWDYRRPQRHLAWDLAEVALLMLTAVAAGVPMVVLLLLYARVSAIAVDSTTLRAAVVGTACALAFVATSLLASGSHTAGAVAEDAFLATGFPLAATVMRMLGGILARLARSTERDRALRIAFSRVAGAADGPELAARTAEALRSVLPERAASVRVLLRDEPGWPHLGILPTARRFALDGGELLDLEPRESLAFWPDAPAQYPVLLATGLVAAGRLEGLALIAAPPLRHDDRAIVRSVVEHAALALGTITLGHELHRRRAEQRIAALTRHTKDVIAVLDREGRVQQATAACQEVIGVDGAELQGSALVDHVHPDDAAAFLAAVTPALGGAADVPAVECRVGAERGGWRHVEVVGSNLLGVPGVDGVVLTVRDVTERRRMEEGLRASEATFRRLFEDNPQPMWVHDEATQRFVAVNDATLRHYGYTREQFLAMTVADVEVRERHHRRAGGDVIEVDAVRHVVPFDGRPAVLTMARDVTEERALQEQLRHQAFHDALTGLPNRVVLTERAAHALQRTRGRSAKRPVVMILDLDGFKSVNDAVGHSGGDEVIAVVADRIAAALRPGDTAARMGGDEFAVLLEDVADVDEAVAVAHRLVQAIEAPHRTQGRTVSLSACVGIAPCGGDRTTVRDLLGDADLAMYVAKGRGRGAVQVFTADLRSAHDDRLRMQEHLSQALRRGQLHVVYQPQVDVAGKRVIGAEALVRWTHPEHGVVPPDVFIPMAEQLGLIGEIDRYVLETACADLARWREQGFAALRVAVNISGYDLDSESLVDDVRRTLLLHMLDPWQLELELTESMAVQQPETAVQRLEMLRGTGVRIAIDDFGTGYSMFSRLRALPIDRLKIDRSFVRDLDWDDDAAAIVQSTVTMGHALGLTLIAEGVESEEVMERLLDLGCDSAQGFHICTPLRAPEFETWLATTTWRVPAAEAGMVG